ncbi:stage II sporulation protein M [Nocardioides pelophilus]|uniref:stage II sporulation protein M n=1 Tax=Nocardioides pelophilus TaxID=2172019 RepID=UPI0028B1F242|nr:stage II sporulation protein M [Nocardioides pelophilus]
MPRIDLDAYVVAHSHEWARLDQLVRARGLSGPQSDELVDRYQQVATHLSVIRTSAPDAEVVAYLSSLLGRARIAMLGARVLSWRAAGRFFTEQFPAALYRMRWWWLGCLAGNIVLTAVLMWWLLDHPEVEQTLLSAGEVDDLVNNDFESYYSENAASAFATRVWVNNAWVAALCIALGILGLPVLYLLFQNVLNIAVIGSIMTRHDRADLFWGLILPHGLLELTAVFVAGGVGLRLFWSWVEPGSVSRGVALAQAGRTAVTCALGLVAVLFVSGIIEAFVTPSPLPTWARIAIGVLAEVAFLLYVFVLGRQAARRGHTGDISADLLEDRVATQD